MLVRDARIRNKKRILEESRRYILTKLRKSLFNFDDLSLLEINQYIETLVLDSEYDLEKDCFIYPFTNEEISLDELAKISYDYITSNIGLFLKKGDKWI